MRIAVFGAVGRLGEAVVSDAVSAGHTVTAVVPSADAAHEARGLGASRAVVGDPYRGAGIADALDGADAVVFVERERRSADDLGVAAVRVTDAMERAGVRRFVALSGAGARDRPGDRTLPLRLYDALRGVRGTSVRTERAFAGRVADADLDWTVVRAARLTDGRGDGVFQHGYRRVGFRDSVSRENAASFLVSVAESASYVGGMPVVTERMEPKAHASGPLAGGAPMGR
ncbi:NAD(P)-dependent oxidoreductase [Halocalculus aciditolerans]|uniref:NmrA family transcriptional regulator n=1 Tax=Halocalculus aciditolerans TaxID=1383812 RepID=A0A830F740_9EURY|nr:NAD(P)-binding oxidoreductase [Halocalculus aciditolerans]GGL69893.1 NmrA family transcriptional regulator [Halocalculus aciditolerans]